MVPWPNSAGREPAPPDSPQNSSQLSNDSVVEDLLERLYGDHQVSSSIDGSSSSVEEEKSPSVVRLENVGQPPETAGLVGAGVDQANDTHTGTCSSTSIPDAALRTTCEHLQAGAMASEDELPDTSDDGELPGSSDEGEVLMSAGSQSGTDNSHPSTWNECSHAERGETYRVSPHAVRVPLDFIGFHTENRGGQGVLPQYVHMLAAKWMCQGTSQRLYESVKVVEVPATVREEWRTANREKHEDDPLCHRADHNECLAAFGRANFLSSLKLCREENRFLFNESAVEIEPREDDSEGQLIQSDGVLCTVYHEALWHDFPALLALSHKDNANDEHSLKEDEVAVFGRVDRIVCSLHNRFEETVERVLKRFEEIAGKHLDPQSVSAVIRFRLSLTTATADIFRQCLFATNQGRSSVAESFYDRFATCFPLWANWAKICCMLYVYRAPLGLTAIPLTKQCKVKDYDEDIFRLIGADGVMLTRVGSFVHAIFRHYLRNEDPSEPPRPYKQWKVIEARNSLLVACGRCLMQTGVQMASAGLAPGIFL